MSATRFLRTCVVCRARDSRENLRVFHRIGSKLVPGIGIGRGYWVHRARTPCHEGDKVAKALARRGIKLERVEL